MTQMTDPLKSHAADDAIDRLLDAHLASSEDLAPSSGFAASVMESIQAQATEPPPIAFPWRRVLPGVIATLCSLLALVIVAARTAREAPPSIVHSLRPYLAQAISLPSTGSMFSWILLACCLAVAGILVSFRLTRHAD
jgi:hypothetical protein